MQSRFRKAFKSARAYVFSHKLISAVLAIIVIWAGYWSIGLLNSGSTETRYVLATAQKGTLIVSVTGSGQVSANDQMDLKPQVSGDITWVGVKPGDTVRVGQALMTIDNTDALQAVSDAKKTLATDELQYQKDVAQAPISYQNDLAALQTAKQNLTNDYNDTFTDLTNTYLDASSVINGAEDALYGYDFDARRSQWNADVLMNLFTIQDTSTASAFETAAKSAYTAARSAYDKSVLLYQKTPRSASNSDVDALLSQTIAMMTDIAQSLQSDLNFYSSVSDLAQTYDLNLPSGFSTVQSNTRSLLSTANSNLSTLLADQKAISDATQAVTSAAQTISLDQVGNPNGANPISLQIAKNNLEKERQDLANQEAELAYYTIRAPFNGTVSAVNVQKGDAASGALATVVSSSEVADLSLNEIDAASVKAGQLATLTFDAVSDLTISGKVVQIDPVGTVSQGVVSYDVQIAFDTQDNRVKPGMTVNASIITASEPDALIVPTNAVTTTNGVSYVEVFGTKLAESSQGVTSATPPTRKEVTTGLSNDTSVEITSGLSEGDQVVTRTVTGQTSSASASTAASSGNVRIGGFRGF